MIQGIWYGTGDDEKDFQWAFNLNQKFLSLLGAWPSHKIESRSKSLRLSLILIISVLGECLPTTYGLIQVQNELNLVVDNLLCTIASWIAASKIFILLYYRSIFGLLIKWAKSDWSRCSQDWEQELMLKQAHRGRLLTHISYAAMITHLVFWFLGPVFDLRMRIINNITDPDPRRPLPIQTYYPYEYYKSPYYELTYLGQIIAFSCGGCAYASADSFFNVLVFHASGQSDILNEKMSRLCDQQENKERPRQSFQERARGLIVDHIHLVRFVATINKSFSYIIFAQVFGSMVLICSSSYAIIKAFHETPSSKQMIILGIALLHMNENLIIYCLTCEILAVASEEMFNGIYNSKWYELPPKEARYVTLILARTQYPLQVTAGKFFYLSLNAYVQIVKSTAGYISMLLAVT